MTSAVLYPGSLVYALDGRTHHHAIIESQPYNDKQNNPVVCITWLTAPHYGHIEISCDRVKELPTKRTRSRPSRFSSGNVAVTITHGLNRETAQGQPTSHSHNRPTKRVLECGQTVCGDTQGTKREKNPRRFRITTSLTRRKRSHKYKSVLSHSKNVKTKTQPMSLSERSKSVHNRFNVQHVQDIRQCSVMFCEEEQLVKLPCRQSCRSKICIPCMRRMLSFTGSDKMRCPTCRQQFSPRTFERIIANYNRKVL